ncbi:hypothetical protein U7230_07260 [Carboxydochorda subterranea]|uniref:Uncharacterized protein n=1 Tax=Carboxydichorda subterranea TaxID=3109565 RepID=A0ABZ1C1W0_9FIRM|nr:hypothetical protein [Limnochorda sp. L945t]WRP18781.1 hypothetical protein U7230_07260 [Limnochorda sp. L945t]
MEEVGRVCVAWRRWQLAIALAGIALAAVAVQAGPAAASARVSVTLTSEERDAARTLLLGSVSAYFGLGDDVMVELEKEEPRPIGLLTAIYVAAEEKLPVRRVLTIQKARGWGWVHGQGHGKGPKWKAKEKTVVVVDDASVEREAFVRFVYEYYAVPRTQVVVWLDQGLSPDDVILAIHVAKRAHVSVERVVALRTQGLGWRVIAARYHVPWVWYPIEPRARFSASITIDF